MHLLVFTCTWGGAVQIAKELLVGTFKAAVFGISVIFMPFVPICRLLLFRWILRISFRNIFPIIHFHQIQIQNVVEGVEIGEFCRMYGVVIIYRILSLNWSKPRLSPTFTPSPHFHHLSTLNHKTTEFLTPLHNTLLPLSRTFLQDNIPKKPSDTIFNLKSPATLPLHFLEIVYPVRRNTDRRRLRPLKDNDTRFQAVSPMILYFGVWSSGGLVGCSVSSS